MAASLEDVEALFASAKQLLTERRKMERFSERAFAAEGPRAQQKANVDLDWQAFHVNKVEHAVHAAAVNAGLADLRGFDSYAPYTVKLTGFHEYQVIPDRPRDLVRTAAGAIARNPTTNDDWNPALTAPQDGVEFIACNRGFAPFVCQFWRGEFVSFDPEDGIVSRSFEFWRPMPDGVQTNAEGK